MTKLIVAARHFANAPKKRSIEITYNDDKLCEAFITSENWILTMDDYLKILGPQEPLRNDSNVVGKEYTTESAK